MTSYRRLMGKGVEKAGRLGTSAALAAGGAVVTGGGAVGAGVAAALVVGESVTDFLTRQLSARQRDRVRTVADLVEEKIRQAVELHGEKVRTDGFFAEQPDGRNYGAEAAEGVLNVARDSNEAKKLPYLANLFTAITVCDFLSVEASHRLIRFADELSWNQLVLLSGVERADKMEVPDVRIGKHEKSWSSWSIDGDLYDIWWERGLIHGGSDTDSFSGIKTPSQSLRNFKLTDSGKALYVFMGLEDIGELDVVRAWRLLVQDDSALAQAAQADEGNPGA